MEISKNNVFITMMNCTWKSKITYILFFTCFGMGSTVAQIPNDYKYQDYKEKFPKETLLFLELSQEDVFDLGKEGLEITTHNREKILYLDNNAHQISQRSVGYDQFSNIAEIEATCYYPEGGKYKKEKVKKFTDETKTLARGVSFYDDSKATQFTYSTLREGAVTELNYSIKHKEPHLLPYNIFSAHVFKEQESYSLRVHEDIDLGYLEINMPESGYEFTEVKEGKYTIYTWSFTNKEKKTIYGDDDYHLYYLPHVIPYIKSYQHKGETHFVYRNLDDLFGWYTSLIDEIEPIKDENLKQLADSLIQGATSEREKVKRIYQWVQSNVKYIAFGDGYGGFVPRNPDQIYERRFGDCKDMSCLTINLLHQVGITAYFTWVGTRHIPYGYTEVFTPNVDNHMIATYITSDGEKIYLDATHADLEFGLPSPFIQGKEVLIRKNADTYEVDTVPIMPSEINAEIDTARFKIEDGTIVGNGRFLFTGYLTQSIYPRLEATDEDKLEKVIKNSLPKGSNKYKPSNIKFYLIDGAKDKMALEYDFEIEDYVKTIDNEMYVNLNLTSMAQDYSVDKKQNIPVFFSYKNRMTKEFYMEIPEGYEVSYLPKNATFENEFISFKVLHQLEGNQIHYTFSFHLNTLQLPLENVEEWNDAIKILNEAFVESTILKAIE